MGKIKEALEKFYTKRWDKDKNSVVPLLYYEDTPELESVCYIGKPISESICWKPVEMQTLPNFTEVESLLGINLHLDIKEFYGSYWAGSIESSHSDEVVSLNGMLNQGELDRVLASIIQHVKSRREELGQQIDDSVFIAGTDSDWYFSVNNKTGEVLLEEPGYPPIRIVASSLEQFINQLE